MTPFDIGIWQANVDNTFVFNSKYDFTVTFPQTSSFPGAFAALTPPNFTTSLSTVLSMLSDRCIQCALPGQALRTTEINRHGLGVREKMPFTAAFNDMPTTFLADTRQDTVHTFWKTWFEHIALSGDSPSSRVPYTIEYKDNYSATIQINEYNLDGSLISSIYLFEAYPIAINDEAMVWSEQNKLVTYTVILTYLNWGFTNESSGSIASSGSSGGLAS